MLGNSRRAPTATERRVLAAVRPLEDIELDIVRCWHELESERAVSWICTPSFVSQVVGPIPWRSIDAWATRHAYDSRAFQLLVDVIGYLDAKFMERQSSERRTQQQRK